MSLYTRLKEAHRNKDADDMSRFDVAYTLGGNREIEEFDTKAQAMRYARDMVAKGATKVFVDQFDKEGDCIWYQNISKD